MNRYFSLLPTGRRHSAVAAVFAAIAALLLSACASSQGRMGTTQVTQTAEGAVVEVQLDDYQILMPDPIPAGQVTFKVTNIGEHPHNFEIEVDGAARTLNGGLGPGETKELTLALIPGTYEVECPVGIHDTLGMRRTVTVKGN